MTSLYNYPIIPNRLKLFLRTLPVLQFDCRDNFIIDCSKVINSFLKVLLGIYLSIYLSISSQHTSQAIGGSPVKTHRSKIANFSLHTRNCSSVSDESTRHVSCLVEQI